MEEDHKNGGRWSLFHILTLSSGDPRSGPSGSSTGFQIVLLESWTSKLDGPRVSRSFVNTTIVDHLTYSRTRRRGLDKESLVLKRLPGPGDGPLTRSRIEQSRTVGRSSLRTNNPITPACLPSTVCYCRPHRFPVVLHFTKGMYPIIDLGVGLGS